MVSFVARITPPCHDITRLLSQSMDRQLPVRTRLAIRLHFEICVWCKRYGQQLEVIRKAGRSVPERAEQISQASLPGGGAEAHQRSREACIAVGDRLNRTAGV
jgi:Putative zinc-finger